jgi:hypothetical protein
MRLFRLGQSYDESLIAVEQLAVSWMPPSVQGRYRLRLSHRVRPQSTLHLTLVTPRGLPLLKWA